MNRLISIIANLKLKELEVVEKLSENFIPNEKILRSLISPNQHSFIAVNGDWKEVLGYSEDDCVNNSVNMILPKKEIERTSKFISTLKNVKEGFSEYKCEVITKGGDVLQTIWRLKYYSDLNIIISIGRLIK